MNAKDLAAECAITSRCPEAFFDVLVVLKLLHRDENELYSLPEHSELFLTGNNQDLYFGGLY